MTPGHDILYSRPHTGSTVTVCGYWEATESATYEVAGVGVVYLRGFLPQR